MWQMYTQTCPSGKAEVTESCPSARTADSSGASLTRHPGQDIPRKRGPGVTRPDLLVITRIDLAPYVGVDPALLERDAKAARGARPFVMASLKAGQGMAGVVAVLRRDGGLTQAYNGTERFTDHGSRDASDPARGPQSKRPLDACRVWLPMAAEPAGEGHFHLLDRLSGSIGGNSPPSCQPYAPDKQLQRPAC